VFAWFYSRIAPRADERSGREQRERLLSEAAGRVVEIGAGTGLNLPLYPRTTTELIVTEPDPHMFKRLKAALGGAGVPVRAEMAPAARIPVEDGWADVVVASLVLCSVPDVAEALAEVVRVLREGGRLVFYEHVRSTEPATARWQDRLDKPWGWFAGGCHPNRDTLGAIERAGFEVEWVDRFDVPGDLLSAPHILGSACRPGSLVA
jgi:SAM-dependent methyltransferase